MIKFIVILFMNPGSHPTMTSYEASYTSEAHCLAETEKSVMRLQENNNVKNATFSCVQKYN